MNNHRKAALTQNVNVFFGFWLNWTWQQSYLPPWKAGQHLRGTPATPSNLLEDKNRCLPRRCQLGLLRQPPDPPTTSPSPAAAPRPVQTRRQTLHENEANVLSWCLNTRLKNVFSSSWAGLQFLMLIMRTKQTSPPLISLSRCFLPELILTFH